MPRQVLQNVENSFVKGLITQASGLNFPENACTSTNNCIFHETGNVTRRKGIDFESDISHLGVFSGDFAQTTYVWKNVADDANTTLLVVQIGNVLVFFDALTYATVGEGVVSDVVSLDDFIPAGGLAPDNHECQFASGHGVLFVFHRYLEPFYLEYDADTQTFTATQINVEIRDFEGEDDGYLITERPALNYAAINDKHHYNLLNQGWTDTNIQAWDTARSDLPSSADIMFLFKNSSDAFDATTVANVMQGNTPATKGHFILSAFDTDRTTASGLANLTNPNTGPNRVSAGAFFAGRVWYAGLNVQSYKGKVYFSQIIEGFDQFGQCYQRNDPTAEDFADLLPTDGGVINIAEAGTIFKLFATQSSLLVFASNGVWAITGSTGLGFTAVDFSVNKIAEIPSISSLSFVSVGGSPMWWNYDGIYTLVAEQSGSYSPKSLTENTIKDFFTEEIPAASRLYAQGAYNNLLKTVQWVYRDVASDSIEENYYYNRILTLNLNTGAFYPWSIPLADDRPTINSIFFLESVPEFVELVNVVDGSANQVIDGSSNNVIVYRKAGIIQPRNMFLTSFVFSPGIRSGRFAAEIDNDYVDFATFEDGPTSYTSEFVTGYKIHGQAQKRFQANYVYLYMNSDADAGAFHFQALWDYAKNTDTNEWSSLQTVTYDDTNYSYLVKRLKVRGSGKVLQYRVESNDDDPFDIAGWSVWETANQSI